MKFDIEAAYLNVLMTDEVYMTLDPDMSKILVEQENDAGEFS